MQGLRQKAKVMLHRKACISQLQAILRKMPLVQKAGRPQELARVMMIKALTNNNPLLTNQSNNPFTLLYILFCFRS